MSEQKRSYYSVIPATVRYDDRLCPNAKLLYGEITALSNEKGYCWASNDYFSKLYKVSKHSISIWINQLKKAGYITIQLNYKEGVAEIVSRHIRICHEGIAEIVNTPIAENCTDNTTYLNNTINNKREENEVCKKIIDYLNKESGKHFKYTESNLEHIKARLKEGFTFDDFRLVIDYKANTWGNDPKMSEYVRPLTLFGTKFESYREEVR